MEPVTDDLHELGRRDRKGELLPYVLYDIMPTNATSATNAATTANAYEPTATTDDAAFANENASNTDQTERRYPSRKRSPPKRFGH